ncbi:MAG: flagellar protein FlgN [Phycisphaerae bacterium]|nr:flagellar protein FlgN [Phycisphaerae bacterium]MDW8262510.1 flagellar protein FlgN [Phycisphaerales bacterium]
MTRFVSDLLFLLEELIVEHRKLLGVLQRQTDAMKALDLPLMENLRTQQEAIRQRIRQIDHRRRAVMQQLAKAHRCSGEMTLSAVAEHDPASGPALLEKRQILRDLAAEIAMKSNVAGQLAGAVLGHLNTAVKLIASAVRNAGVYTRNGIPRVGPRIGAMEAVA